MCVFVSVCGYLHMCAGLRCQTPMELEFEVLVSCLTWVVGTELGSSAVVIYTLNH